VDASGNLGQTSRWTVDVAGTLFSIDLPLEVSYPSSFIYSPYSVYLVGSAALLCEDASNSVQLCDGAHAVYVSVGSITVQGTSGNTLNWVSSIAAPTPQTVLVLPLSVFGQGTISQVLGTPDAWVLVSVGGTNYKMPLYLP
jgi:hypothetical protein